MIYIYNPTIYPTMISIRIIHWDEPVLPSTFKMGGGLGGDDQQAVNTAFFLWFGNICDFVDEIPRVWQMNMLVSTWEYRSSNHATTFATMSKYRKNKLENSFCREIAITNWVLCTTFVDSIFHVSPNPACCASLRSKHANSCLRLKMPMTPKQCGLIYIYYIYIYYTLYNENIKWCTVYIYTYIISITYTII